jgi:hypothetical protein
MQRLLPSAQQQQQPQQQQQSLRALVTTIPMEVGGKAAVKGQNLLVHRRTSHLNRKRPQT